MLGNKKCSEITSPVKNIRLKHIYYWLLKLFCLFAFSFDAFAFIHNHEILYGKISDSDIATIASENNLVVLGAIKADQLIKMKRINRDLIIIKYIQP